MRTDLRFIREDIVNHPTVISIERAHLERLAGGFYTFGDALNLCAKLIFLD
jgi:hypothetical protein